MARNYNLLVSLSTLLLLAGCTSSGLADADVKAAAFVMDQVKLVVSVLAFGGTVWALVFGFRQYIRAEKWKRAEFLAKEMKEFFANDKISTALLLSDWGNRHIRLRALTNPGDSTLTNVTRQMQIAALLPHSVVEKTLGSDTEAPSDERESADQAEAQSEGDEPRLRRFTREQAIIRDCYDAYLDGLERFGSYLSTKLVTVEDLKPYLNYWIEDLVSPTTDLDDATWAACVITYANFYRFDGVRHLFEEFGHDIGPDSNIYLDFVRLIPDQALAEKLRTSLIRPARSTVEPRSSYR